MKTVDYKRFSHPSREQFLSAIELRELPSEEVRKRLAFGNALICAMTAATVVLTLLFHDRATSADTAIAGGMELLGMLVSVLIYYSYMQDPDSAEVHTRLFATLIVTNVTGMFLAGCSWLMDGVAVLALLHRLCVTALVFVNAAICYQFWLYSAYLLGIEREKSRRITRALQSIGARLSGEKMESRPTQSSKACTGKTPGSLRCSEAASRSPLTPSLPAFWKCSSAVSTLPPMWPETS